jgi:hypothetical protein
MISDFPDRYGRSELVLMVVHPFLLYAYWEVTAESLQQAQAALGAEMDGARAVLRMYDISLIHFDGKNAHHVFDIDIGLEARHWYLPVWTAEKSYCADLGFLARTGRFHQIMRSNILHTPRAAPSHRTDEQWMRVRFVRLRKPDPARQFEFVPAPGRSREGSWQAQSSQRLSESVAEYLAGAPSSRLGPR